MKTFIIYISILTIPLVQGSCLFAQKPGKAPTATLSGKITSTKTGEPLAGASIYFPDLRKGGTSGDSGQFRIPNIPQGKYLLEISYLGYASDIEHIDIHGDIQRDFSLAPSLIENQAVTVLGVSSASSVKRIPIPVSVVKRDELFRNSSTNLVDNLSKIPGISQVSTGPAISKPFIRGLGYNRVIVVHDGIKQEGQQWGDEHGIEIDELNVNRVEILKGPASLTYGSDALAGVVNILSISPAPEGHTRGNILASYQTNNRQRDLHGDIGGNKNGFTWGLDGSYKAAADYKNKYDGYVFNSKFNERDFGGYVGINKSWGSSRLYASSFDQHTGLVEGDRDETTGKFIRPVNDNGVEAEAIAAGRDFSSTDPFIPRQRIQHFKIATDNSFKLGSGRLTTTLGYQRNQRKEFGNVLDPGEKALYFDLETFNYNLQYHFAGHNNWQTTIGVNGMQQSNKNKGMEVLIPEYHLFDIGGFVYTQKRMDKITLSGGARYDIRALDSKELREGSEIKFEGFTRHFSNISGSAGLTYQATDKLTLKLNVARGFRAPAMAELASNGAHEGTNRFEYGEQDLKSETSLQTDAGIEIGSEHISFNASVFFNPIQNFIYYRKLEAAGGGDSLITSGGETFYAFRFSQDNAKLYGAECNLDFHPHPLDWLHVENTFSYVRGLLARAEDGSNNLPFIPPARLINEIKTDFAKKGKTFRNGFVSVQLDNTFHQNHPFTGYNTETATPGYSLLSMAVGGDFVHKGKTVCSLYFSGNNLTDVAYQNHLSRLKYAPENLVTGRMGVFNMGRSFSLKLNIPLDL